MATLLLAGLFVYIYATVSPESSNLFPKCLFLQLTGFRCPGCGSQRVIHSLLTGDISAAFRYNAFMILMIPYIIVLITAYLLRKKHPKLYLAVCNKAIIITIFILVILWWILRNIYGW